MALLLSLVEDVNTLEIFGGLAQTCSHRFFGGSEGGTRIVVLLVRLVISVGVSDLSLEEVVVVSFVLTDSVPEGPLGVSVDVHFDDSSFDGVLDIFDRRTRTSVENELHGLVVTIIELLSEELLGVVKDNRLKVNISRSVNSVDVSEGSGAGEGGVFNLGKLFVGIPDFFGLGVKTFVVDIGVVNTIFFSSGDTEFEFKKNV
mmetsp:Transcript_24492/g.52146  ORF Transcript_24492/g.52146 Transcript_24492/m.52146 type:complete len:202 (+) Transcript_24492:272-877(+)